MKKTSLMLISLLAIAVFTVFAQKENRKIALNKNIIPSPSQVKQTHKQTTSLFIPYWSLSDTNADFDNYDQLLYFGITPTKTGINTDDAGYLRLDKFVSQAGENRKKILVLRMLDSNISFPILKDSAKQNTIINETLSIAKENGFDGIALDLELSALPFDTLIQQINSFSANFSNKVKKHQLEFGIIIYGDTFYRIRPFDIKTLAKSSDYMMIMAYDLHKAGGNPGPNFPLSGKDKYGYDYSSLTENFLQKVPAGKLNVIFGLFGYDWQVDDKGIAQKTGLPLSYLQIKREIIDKCSELNCIVNRDQLSAETKIFYTDKDGKKHIVWFEDMESVTAKQKFLEEKGITSFTFWAYSYF